MGLLFLQGWRVSEVLGLAWEDLDHDAGIAHVRPDTVTRTVLPVVVAYGTAILVGLLLPAVAVGLYCAIAVLLVVPFRELKRLLLRRS